MSNFRGILLCGACLLSSAAPTAVQAAGGDRPAEGGPDGLIILDAITVRANRPEDFGFGVTRGIHFISPIGSTLPQVATVFPNTAASKAGLRPGDRIVTSDGVSAALTIFTIHKWKKIMDRKMAEVASGKKVVSWTLEVEGFDGSNRRTVKLTVPTPPPHWGAKVWQRPADRMPAVVSEAGPLAPLARAMLENGVWMMRDGGFVTLGGPAPKEAPRTGYGWTIAPFPGDIREIVVTQQRGRTEISLQHFNRDLRMRNAFETSPAGDLETAVLQFPGGPRDDDPEHVRAAFQAELDFWLNEVGRVSPRWPFELRDPKKWMARALAPAAATGAAPVSRAFLVLPRATAAQRTLLADALGRIGADADRFAYTETSRGLDDKQTTVVRVNPAQPEAECCTLREVNGRAPTEAEVKHWREMGRDVPAPLGDLPPIASLVDQGDVRIFADESAATVFELPLRGGGDFPADKFQALFRVNKAQRTFEDITVKMRESFRVAGVAKVTDAGLSVRFQTFDAQLAPQPVALKAGGAVRLMLLVKLGRSIEIERTDFLRVQPFAEPAVAGQK